VIPFGLSGKRRSISWVPAYCAYPSGSDWKRLVNLTNLFQREERNNGRKERKKKRKILKDRKRNVTWRERKCKNIKWKELRQ
jgi:hypothetical protein